MVVGAAETKDQLAITQPSDDRDDGTACGLDDSKVSCTLLFVPLPPARPTLAVSEGGFTTSAEGLNGDDVIVLRVHAGGLLVGRAMSGPAAGAASLALPMPSGALNVCAQVRVVRFFEESGPDASAPEGEPFGSPSPSPSADHRARTYLADKLTAAATGRDPCSPADENWVALWLAQLP